ncbi:SGNH/GDSL hydrolase family protein [Dyadobacter bucti]|uniref:SGNH/GDSL hydrolase family protein n=1 Tax=Dyadobacter bucti TaxID=2572203 RepID=UPI00110854A0|nr:SGNH/GDSL hydrolase family protein [Dyadobacter bucti]
MILLFLFPLFLQYCAEPIQLVRADDKSISYTGRFDFSDRAKPRFMYSGCTIGAGFTGTSIAIKMKDDSLRNWFNVRIDDQLFKFESADSSGIYLLARNLPDKAHRITITRRTESHGGNTTFDGFIIDSGKTLYPLPRLTRTIEFIGNSLTCGYGNEGKSREEHFKYETQNADLVYGALVARKLDANYVAICRSGIGMLQSYDGNKGIVQPKLYDEIVAGSNAQWDYSANQPDIVVIELGANDLVKTLDSALFVNTYIAFVKKLRSQYPETDIICAAGPNLPGDRSLAFQSYVRSVQAQFKNTDKRVHYLDFGTVDANGSDWHQNLKEHQQMADALLPYIKKLKNW